MPLLRAILSVTSNTPSNNTKLLVGCHNCPYLYGRSTRSLTAFNVLLAWTAAGSIALSKGT